MACFQIVLWNKMQGSDDGELVQKFKAEEFHISFLPTVSSKRVSV